MARSDIVIPGEDLQQAADAMRRVLQNINLKRSSADFTRVVGSPVRDAAENFEDRWDAGSAYSWSTVTSCPVAGTVSRSHSRLHVRVTTSPRSAIIELFSTGFGRRRLTGEKARG